MENIEQELAKQMNDDHADTFGPSLSQMWAEQQAKLDSVETPTSPSTEPSTSSAPNSQNAQEAPGDIEQASGDKPHDDVLAEPQALTKEPDAGPKDGPSTADMLARLKAKKAALRAAPPVQAPTETKEEEKPSLSDPLGLLKSLHPDPAEFLEAANHQLLKGTVPQTWAEKLQKEKFDNSLRAEIAEVKEELARRDREQRNEMLKSKIEQARSQAISALEQQHEQFPMISAAKEEGLGDVHGMIFQLMEQYFEKTFEAGTPKTLDFFEAAKIIEKNLAEQANVLEKIKTKSSRTAIYNSNKSEPVKQTLSDGAGRNGSRGPDASERKLQHSENDAQTEWQRQNDERQELLLALKHERKKFGF